METMRDEIAMAVMHSIIPWVFQPATEANPIVEPGGLEEIARTAYLLADAMLAEREK